MMRQVLLAKPITTALWWTFAADTFLAMPLEWLHFLKKSQTYFFSLCQPCSIKTVHSFQWKIVPLLWRMHLRLFIAFWDNYLIYRLFSLLTMLLIWHSFIICSLSWWQSSETELSMIFMRQMKMTLWRNQMSAVPGNFSVVLNCPFSPPPPLQLSD